MSALLGVAMATGLTLMAQHHCSREAEIAARTVDPTALAPRFEILRKNDRGELSFQSTIAEGTGLPRDLGMQLENSYLNQRADGLPEGPGISDNAMCTYFRRMGHFDKGFGCSLSLATAEGLCRMDESTIRRASAYAREIGMEEDYSRVKQDARKIGGAASPCTEFRTTVRRFYPIPLHRAAELTEAKMLALIAPPRLRNIPTLVDPASPVDPGSSEAGGAGFPSAPPPRPRPATLKDALSVWGELTPAERAFLPAVEAIHAATSCWVSPHVLAKEALRVHLALDQAVKTVHSVARHYDKQNRAREACAQRKDAASARPWRYSAQQVLVLCFSWYETQLAWLKTKAGQASLAEESKQRELAYRDAYKTPQQNEREGYEKPERETAEAFRKTVGNMGLAAEAKALAPAAKLPNPKPKPPVDPRATRLGIVEAKLLFATTDQAARKALEDERDALMAALASRGPPLPD